MKQQCYLVAIYLNWFLLLGGITYLLFQHRYEFAVAWLILLPLAIWAYIQIFPSISHVLGYGKVDDIPAGHNSAEPNDSSTAVTVTLYTALGCPFCPIVEKRLRALRETVNFELEKVDVTLRPDLLTVKGIRAVPVVEVGERRIGGNATSEQLADLILAARADPGLVR